MRALATRWSIWPVAALLAAACGGSSSPSAPSTTPSSPSLTAPTAFRLTGDPASASGATWTYQAAESGTTYDLQGILFKPPGSGPFPAVIISHGDMGNVSAYPTVAARIMVGWGLVAIATNYTHAGGVPIGSPGTATQIGASPPNLRRAEKLLDLLRTLGYVDMRRVAAHGHSMGGYVTALFAAADSSSLLVASHTAAGAQPDGVVGAGPSESQVATITVPYQMHHGDADATVPLANDQLLAAVLTRRAVDNQLFVYPGAGHADVQENATVFARVRTWYTAHGLFR